VYADLAAQITQAAPLCVGATPDKVQVRVAPSATSSLSALPPSVGGSGSGYIDALRTDGIRDVLPWIVIKTGVDPYAGTQYHGVIRINFHGFVAPWHLDYNTAPAAGTMDLYSVTLHEAIHMLGVGSFIDSNGSSFYSLISGANSGGYSRWDKLMRRATGNLSLIVNPSAYNWTLNPALSLPGNFQNSCNGVDIVAGSNNAPVHTGTAFQFGSSLSHLNETCNGSSNTFVMHPTMVAGTMKRNLSTVEIQLMKDLGYNINGASNCAPAAAHNQGPGCTGLYTLQACPGNTLTLNYADIIANDPGVTGIKNVEMITSQGSVVAVTPGNLQGNYIFTPGNYAAGQYTIRYLPVGCGGEIGNIAYIYIQVAPCAQCGFGSTAIGTQNPNAIISAPCGGPGQPACVDCGFNKNPCNLVCNPEMCSNDVGFNSGWPFYYHFDCSPPPAGPAFELPGWFRASATPGYVSRNFVPFTGWSTYPSPIHSQSGYLHLAAWTDEMIYTPVSVSAGKRYLFSSYVNAGRINGTLQARLRTFILDQAVPGTLPMSCAHPMYFTNTFPSVPTNTYQEMGTIDLNEHTIPNGQVNNYPWDRSGYYATLGNTPANPGYLMLAAQKLPGVNGQVDILVDQVEFLEDKFTAGNDVTLTCNQSVTLGGTDFCMLSDVRVRYTWRDVPTSTVRADYWVERELNGTYTIFNYLTGTTVTSIPNFAVMPPVTTDYELTRTFVLDIDGTFGRLPATTFNGIPLTDQVRVTVPSYPTAPATFTWTVSCNQVVFQSDPAAQSTAFAHSWDFNNDGIEDSQAANPVWIGATSGTYNVRHKISNGCVPVSVTLPVTITLSGAGIAYPLEIEGTSTTTPELGAVVASNASGIYVGGILIAPATIPGFATPANAGVYVAAYDASGCNANWRYELPVAAALPFDNIDFLGIAGGPSGSVYLGFSFSGSFTTSTGTYTAIDIDIAIIKLNASGNVVWVHQEGGAGDQYLHDLEALGSRLYVTGRTGTDALTFQVQDNGSSSSVTWLQNLANAMPTRLNVAANGDCFISGIASSTVSFATVNGSFVDVDPFVAKYNSVGIESWLTVIGKVGPDLDRSNMNSVEDICVHPSGDVYLTYLYSDNFGAGPSPQAFDIGAQLVKLDASGGIVWQVPIATPNSWTAYDPFNPTVVAAYYTGSITIPRGLTLLANGNVLASGVFQAGLNAPGNFQSPPLSFPGVGTFQSNNHWNLYNMEFDANGTIVGGFVNTSMQGDASDGDLVNDSFIMDTRQLPSGAILQSLLADGPMTFNGSFTGNAFDVLITRFLLGGTYY
jgi:hypothetical protein